MTELNAKLSERVRQLKAEINAVERGREPVQVLVDRALAEVDAARAAFIAAPFKPAIFNPDALRGDSVGRMILSAFAAMMPEQTTAIVQASVLEREKAWQGLRLTDAEKIERTDALLAELRKAEARIEMDRRRIEREGAPVMSRRGSPPDIWLLTDSDLERAVQGLPPAPFEERIEHEPSYQTSANAGRI
jgi:hypothetical protein